MGSKKDLLGAIGEIVSKLGATTAIDVFSGTTRVAQYLRQMGLSVQTSDLSWATSVYAATYVHNRSNAHLRGVIDLLNDVVPLEGWLTANYTGEGPQEALRSDGRCFQRKNTMKADAARDAIDALDLEPWEHATLVTSIIRALDAVDNTVGVQQAYLKEWCKRSYKDIVFELPACVEGPTGQHFEGDCLSIGYAPADVAYIDPPYSAHSYATYYHIWDSIARWDKPETGLKARRRADRVSNSQSFDSEMVSPWNSKKTALTAFRSLVDRLPVKHCVISYSDESLIDRTTLISAMEELGTVVVHEIDYRRNIMSQIGNATVNGEPEKDQKNKELIIVVTKA